MRTNVSPSTGSRLRLRRCGPHSTEVGRQGQNGAALVCAASPPAPAEWLLQAIPWHDGWSRAPDPHPSAHILAPLVRVAFLAPFAMYVRRLAPSHPPDEEPGEWPAERLRQR